jgi:hypothetical protein
MKKIILSILALFLCASAFSQKEKKDFSDDLYGSQKESKKDFSDDLYGSQKESKKETLPDYLFEENDNGYIYCELVGEGKFLSLKLNVRVDFGYNVEWKEKHLRGEDGKKITFTSMVDAMNYMGKMGWEFVQAYVVTSGSQNVYHWLLKKKKQ